jgi:hypothetical protein
LLACVAGSVCEQGRVLWCLLLAKCIFHRPGFEGCRVSFQKSLLFWT